ncbi:hypothetical protein CCACVL1_20262 [Corchorus capsularis]|uniref:Retrotransposon Copia-like N-terminal domain-containing protein n=1 Tax=Corchorus capsularis TaxID=210143 RepID=A0A1R3HBY3_COCAP|nr:hypothetical protein CCACVL1_20262 [Corchorus capsularis]
MFKATADSINSKSQNKTSSHACLQSKYGTNSRSNSTYCDKDFREKHGSHPTPPKTINDQPNPAYTTWFRNDQLVLSWIIGSTHESYLSQIVGAATALEAWNKLATTYASGSRAQIRLLKSDE